MNPLCRAVAVAFAGTILWAACGGDSDSGDDPVALCKQTCNKIAACFDGGGFQVNCDTQCNPKDGGGGGQSCKNADAQSAHLKTCLEKEACQELFACFESVPPCDTTGGTGGSGGSGGAGGSGGGGGSGAVDAGNATCATLLACCNAATNADIKSLCMMNYNMLMGNDANCAIAYGQLRPVVCP